MKTKVPIFLIGGIIFFVGALIAVSYYKEGFADATAPAPTPAPTPAPAEIVPEAGGWIVIAAAVVVVFALGGVLVSVLLR